MAAKKKSISKSDFIRTLPRELPADQVVAKGKEAGLSFDKNYVYKTRARDAKAGGGPRRGPGRPPASAKSATAAPAPRPVGRPPGRPAGKKPGRKPGRPAGRPTHVATAPAAHKGDSIESRFVTLALDLGLARAEALLQQTRTRLRSLLS
jgi:hypothetical protein